MTIGAHLSKASQDRGIVFAAAAVAVLGLIVNEIARKRRRRPRGVPAVPGHWLFGNLLQVIVAAKKKQHLDMGFNHHKRFGKTIALHSVMGHWTVKTTCPKNLEYILKTNFLNYPKGPFFQDPLRDLLGEGIFNTDGHSWYVQRKVSSRMFTSRLFKEHIWAVVQRNAQKLCDILESSNPEVSVDVFNLMNRFTVDTISEIGFGKCIGSLEDPSSPFLESFDKAQNISFWRFRNPLWKLCRFFGNGTERETKEQFGRVDAFSRSIVHELVDSFDREMRGAKNQSVGWSDIEARKSFVGLFMEDAKSRGETLTEDYLRDLVLNFLLAGRDTTAQGLSWTIFFLSQHPAVEARARQEVHDDCGVRGPVYDDTLHLPYLNAVISEALRLYPSVPLDRKVALADDTWPDGTFIPRGTSVAYDIYSMGRDRSIWGEDAEVFRPERWLEMKQNPSNYEYPVFNAGPRECLGRRLAMVEMKTCLAMLLPHVSFQLAVPSSTITPDLQLTLGMANGLPCFVHKVTEKEKRGSNVSTSALSECETVLSDLSVAADEAESADVGPRIK